MITVRVKNVSQYLRHRTLQAVRHRKIFLCLLLLSILKTTVTPRDLIIQDRHGIHDLILLLNLPDSKDVMRRVK